MEIPKRKVNVAIIGVGLIGPRHAKTVLNSPEANLIAIVDFAPQSIELARSLGAQHYRSIQEMLVSPHKPDAAIICTPNHTHVALTKELVDGGVHVLVEKPVSTDIASGRDLLEHTSRNNAVHVLVGHHRRFNPYIIATKESITSGSIGDIIAINGLWTTYKPADYFDAPTQWRAGKTGGVILINLIHEVDLLHYLFGPIARVHAEKTISRRGHEAEEGAAIVLRFSSGVVGTFLISDNLPSPHNFESGTGENPLIPKTGADFYRIFGTNGILSVPDMSRWSYDAGKKTWLEPIDKTKFPVVDGVPFEFQLDHFVKVIRGEELANCTVGTGLAALIVCEAVKQSIETGQTVEVEPLHLM